MNLASDAKENHTSTVVTEANKSGEQKAAEADVESFRKELGPFVAAAETTRMAMIFTDAKEPGHPIIFANDSFLVLTGYSREEVLAQSFTFLMAGETKPAELAEIETAFVGQNGPDAEIGAAARMATRSGSPSMSARFSMKTVMLCSTSPRWWISPGIGARRTASASSSTS